MNRKSLLKPLIGIFVFIITASSFSIATLASNTEIDDEWNDTPYTEKDAEDNYYEDNEDENDYDDDWDDKPSPEDPFVGALNPDRDYLIVVNDDNKYSFKSDYHQALKGDLIYIDNVDGDPVPIEKGAGEAFSMLRDYLADQGILIELNSAYHTKKQQKKLYKYYKKHKDSLDRIAKAGYSEHHTGLLLDIVIWWPEIDDWVTETSDLRDEDSEFFSTVHDAFADYGFIDRYPEGAEDITGFPAEPYEIRFVGSSDVAHEIMDNELCLEEYLGID